MKKIIIEGMHCANCSKRVEKALSKLGKNIVVSHTDGTAEGEFKPNVSNDMITDAIESLGFVVKSIA